MKRLCFVMVVMIIFCLFVSSAHSDDILTSCGDMDYPPFTYSEKLVDSKDTVDLVTGDPITGVCAEVLQLIFGELGIKVDSRYVGNWKRCQKRVEDGTVDMIMGAYKTKEREEIYLYPETPIAPDPVTIFVWKGREFKFDQWDDLKGKRAGIARGVSVGDSFGKWLKENATIDVGSRRSNNYKKLEAGRIDFCVGGMYAELIEIKSYGFEGKIIPLKNPVKVENTYVAISKKSKFLEKITQLEEGLKKLHADGTIERLISKHIGQYEISRHKETQ